MRSTACDGSFLSWSTRMRDSPAGDFFGADNSRARTSVVKPRWLPEFMGKALLRHDFNVFEPHLAILPAVELEGELAFPTARVVLQLRALDAVHVNDDVTAARAHGHLDQFTPLVQPLH